MNIYTMYISLFVLTILLFILIKDKLKALKLTGILTISSSILLLIISFIVKILITNNITIINISNITNYIFKKFISTSIILFIIGITEILLSKSLITKKVTRNPRIKTYKYHSS